MTVSITYEIVKTTPRADAYYVEVQVLSATDIEPQIFVFDVEHQAFTGVATVYDMRVFPSSRDAAIAANLAYFRAVGVVKNFQRIDQAEYFSSYTESRIKLLQEGWQVTRDGFVADETVTVPEPI